MRPPAERDLPRVVEYASDPLTRRWLGHVPQPYGETDARAWLDDLTERHSRGNAVTWTVADPVTDLLMGVVNVFDLSALRAPGSWATSCTRRAVAGGCAGGRPVSLCATPSSTPRTAGWVW